MSDQPPGKYRIVGKREIPEDHVYPLDTPEQRTEYFRRIRAMEESMLALRPVARIMATGEPRVKRFRTLEEANADQIEGMVRTMEYLNRKRTYCYE